MRLQDDEAEERFRKLDETLFMRRKKSREQKEAAASRLPWKRKHKRKQKRLPSRTVFSLTVNKLFADCTYWTCSCAAPHSMHASASISYLPSPSAIAPTGHSPSQVPHIIHSSLILYAICFSSLEILFTLFSAPLF